MHVLLTGGTGYVGRFIAEKLHASNHEVILLGRNGLSPHAFHPWSLTDPSPVLPRADALVHCAYDHVPGAYRGGEGDDPEGFWARNHDGSVALFDAAERAGASRIVFLSSRAVYADARRGETLRETDPAEPDSLYGKLKLSLEKNLADRPGLTAASVRATGIYGTAPGNGRDKWRDLFTDYLAGKPIKARMGTELHGEDLAAAVLLLVESGAAGAFNASDILLDRHDLLERVQKRIGCPHPPPERFSGTPPGIMDTQKLQDMGWSPGGMRRLADYLSAASLERMSRD
ncbi:NAD-dependent epimerase/dehydratase family protein [Amaricoccus macauensis]|uniref:NAD-dependent epimerase/dehydratase family protein n=1 Tax=Amaricoccus macauensis TaxID=57001 RepID=UPI003C7ED71C